MYDWARADSQFKDAITDERGSLVDECLVSARVLALGIPEKDENGNFIGWRERPDGYMIRYLLSTLGRKEGFGDREDEDADIPKDIDHGISIDSWIKDKLENDCTPKRYIIRYIPIARSLSFSLPVAVDRESLSTLLPS